MDQRTAGSLPVQNAVAMRQHSTAQHTHRSPDALYTALAAHSAPGFQIWVFFL